jgi:hypothetical protein
MPDDDIRKAKRRTRKVRLAGYLIAGTIIGIALGLAWTSPLGMVVFVVESWWLWAVWTDPGAGLRDPAA